MEPRGSRFVGLDKGGRNILGYIEIEISFEHSRKRDQYCLDGGG